MNFPKALTGPRAGDALAAISGAAAALAFAPLGWWPLSLLGLAGLFLLWHGQPPRRAALRGLWFGLGYFGVGVSWVFVAIHVFGHSGVPVAVLLTALFVAFFALYPLLAGFLAARYLTASPRVQFLLLWPVLWMLVEWLRGWFLSGFPWLTIGYSFIDTPLAGFAPLIGVYGVTWLAGLIAGLIALAVVEVGRVRWLALGVIPVLFVVGAGLQLLRWTEPVGEPIKVALVQGNIPQDTKWRPELVQRTLDTYANLTREHWGNRLIVWPEAAITLFYHEAANDYLAPLAREARTQGASIVLGIPVREPGTRRYFNSLVSLDEPVGFYHKRHLVPFGDYVPGEELLRGLIRFFDLPMSGFSHGPDRQPLLVAAGHKLASTVCYEDIFGNEVIESLPEAALLINATNNAWYGDSFAPHQHLEMSRWRALETGRDLLRATTNGVSALVDAQGRITARSAQFATAVVTGTVQARQGASPYVRSGNWPVILLSLAVLGAGLWFRRRSRLE